jgi:hypothetical protein
MKEKLARWFITKYLPDMHLHANPKVKKERPKVQGVLNMSREQYMELRLTKSSAELNAEHDYILKSTTRNWPPDPKDYEDPAEFEHEREKWVMKMEAQREGDR